MSSITDSVESIQSLEAVVGLEVVLASLKSFAVADLFKVSKMSLAEAERRVKSGKTEPKVEKEKKPMPKQLRKPTEWVAYVLRYSLANGWPAFSAVNTKSHEEITYPASELKEGEHMYPSGKKMILTHAMSLSKKYWAPKAKEGTREDLYREFEAWFEAQPVEEAARAESPKAPMVRKTAEEKEAEKKDKEAKKAEAAEAAKALKLAAKEAKKAATPAKAVKAASAPASPALVPAKAAVAAAVAVPAAAGVKPGPKKKVAKAVEEWSCPTDGNVYPWPYKGENLLRDFENRVWNADADGGLGDWKGIFHPEEDRIDDTVADPYADEEDEE